MTGALTLWPMRLADLGLVEDWLGEPHVARWFLVGSTVQREIEELRQAVTGQQPTHALMVLDAARPIGWCQWYACHDYPDHAEALGARSGDIGIDYAIGDPTRIGQGTGTALVGAMVAWIRKSHPQAGVVADPEAANVASRRVLEKNGFQLLSEGPLASEPTDAVMAIYRLAPCAESRHT